MIRELKRAYQELVLKFHPDKTGGKECEEFISVQVGLASNKTQTWFWIKMDLQEAWQVLGDVEQRAR